VHSKGHGEQSKQRQRNLGIIEQRAALSHAKLRLPLDFAQLLYSSTDAQSNV
jgi:hypothetical protein